MKIREYIAVKMSNLLLNMVPICSQVNCFLIALVSETIYQLEKAYEQTERGYCSGVGTLIYS